MILHNELNLSERDLVPDHLENSLDRPTLETTMLDESRHRGSIHPITIPKITPFQPIEAKYPPISLFAWRHVPFHLRLRITIRTPSRISHGSPFSTAHSTPIRNARTHARKHARAHTERSDERETEREDTKSAHLLRVPPP